MVRSHRLYFYKNKRGIGVMKKISKFLDKNSLLMLYRTLVETHLRYCNVVWGQCNETLIDILQILQNKAVRVITKSNTKMLTTWDLLVNLAGKLSVVSLNLTWGFSCIRAKTRSSLKQLGNVIYQRKWFIHIKQGQLSLETCFCHDMS